MSTIFLLEYFPFTDIVHVYIVLCSEVIKNGNFMHNAESSGAGKKIVEKKNCEQ